jgi:ATP-dependent DNA ligase
MRRTGIQLCYPLEEKRILSWAPPYICQPKLDGERCRAILNPSEPYPASVTLISSEGNFFQSVPHLIEPLHKLAQLTGPIELDGELYVKGMSFEQVHSIVGRTVNLSEDHDIMQLHLFDVVDENLPQWERLEILGRVKSLCSSPEIQFVQNRLVETFDEILRAYDAFVEDGYEGIIIRHVDAQYVRRRSLYVLKFKPKKEDIYHIVGFKQMVDKTGQPKPMLGALECVSNKGEATFSVGSGMTDEFRHIWWPESKAAELIGKMLRVKYQHITEKQVPRFPVFIEVVEPMVNPLL